MYPWTQTPNLHRRAIIHPCHKLHRVRARHHTSNIRLELEYLLLRSKVSPAMTHLQAMKMRWPMKLALLTVRGGITTFQASRNGGKTPVMASPKGQVSADSQVRDCLPRTTFRALREAYRPISRPFMVAVKCPCHQY